MLIYVTPNEKARFFLTKIRFFTFPRMICGIFGDFRGFHASESSKPRLIWSFSRIQPGLRDTAPLMRGSWLV
jgi:hypothetical protein